MANNRLLVEISGHGLGHLSQTAPVINALRRRMPELLLTVRTEIPEGALRKRIDGPFQAIAATTDPGLVMNSAVHVDVEASREAYRRYHARWPQAVDAAAFEIDRLKADFVFTNVSYLALAGAARAEVPCASMSSINWADVFGHYCAGDAVAVAGQIHASYAVADPFLALTPGMPMPDMPRLQRIGPVAARGRSRAHRIRKQLGLPPGCPLVLLALGGIPTRITVDPWPDLSDMAVITWLGQRITRPGYFDGARLEVSFLDLLASCDAVVTKPGYGTFVEAACNGVRVLYTRRPDWPETRWLCDWLQIHGLSAAIDWGELMNGAFIEPLRRLLAHPAKPPADAGGIDAAVAVLASRLAGRPASAQSTRCQ